MILRRNVSLAVGDTIEFAFMYGYAPAGSSVSSLIAKYSYGLTRGNVLQTMNGEAWRRNIPHLSVEGDAAMGREVAWHYAMARQTLTFDSFFMELILDQGTAYRYDFGFQGAARDPLQHALPFILTEPSVLKSVVRYTLKELHPPATWGPNDTVSNLPYFVIGHGIAVRQSSRPSDEELYLLFTVTE